MGKSLDEIAIQLKECKKKVQLIYAFNGTGKTRLSRAFKELIAPKNELEEENGLASKKILYYNAFTEDLFYWDNDLDNDTNLKLKIHPNAFTEWVFVEQGQELNVISNFQEYINNHALTPKFNEDFSEVTFSLKKGNDEDIENIKISKGEESNFVWSIFYSLLEQVVSVLNVPEESDRETDKLNQLEYIFIDDPVTSLDDNHLIQMAVNLSDVIRKSESDLKFIITTHSPLFYNVLYNELKIKNNGYMLEKNEDGSYELDTKFGDSNENFSYHHHLIGILKRAIEENKVEKYHFTLLRNLYEKAANFLGYEKWSDLLPDDKEVYAIKCFGDDNTKNIVLEKSYQEYMNGFKDIVTGEARRGYVDVVQELKSRFADVDEITTEKEKKEFVKLFGEYLKIENILQNYDEFTNLKELQKIDLADSEALEIFKSTHFVSDEDIKAMQLVDILEERTVQDYRSKYNDIREWIRREREGKEKGNSKIDWDDVVFEVDLLKSQEINLDYILELIYEKNKNTKDKNILIDEIRRIVRASTGNRAKESLIVAFINQTDLDEIQDKASIIDAFFQFAQMEQKREAEELIMEEKLNEEAAKRYILTSLRKEYASENGTDLNEILPKMSPLNPQYHTKKQSVFEKISTFVEKFKGVGGVI